VKKSTALFCAALLANLTVPSYAAENPASIKLCYQEGTVYPWVLKDKPGLNIVLLRGVEQKLGVKLELIAQSWKRCQEEMRSGAFDGIFAASFKTDRLEMGHFPMAGGKPDEAKAMMMDSYTLYRLKGSAAQWDGKTLTSSGAIAAQTGYSIIEQLKTLGARVDDGSPEAADNLKKLLAGRVSAAALQTLEAERALASDPEFSNKIEAVSTPLVKKAFYLMLSKQFVAKYSNFSSDVWNAVGQVRESAEYKAKAAAFK